MRKKRATNSRKNEAVYEGFISDVSRRDVLLGGVAVLLTMAVPSAAAELTNPSASSQHSGDMKMDTITTKDGVTIFYKDWGTGQPIVFSHGWPLTADDWDTQLTFFLARGFRVIAHDRRGHGRSTQVATGHDMDHYADDLAALTAHLNLKDAIHVSHSTGGGEVTRYIGRHGESRVAKAVLISSVPPIMVKTPANPGGLPKEVFDGLQAQTNNNRAQFFFGSANRSLLWLQPSRRESVPGHHYELVATGHDGKRQGSLRRDCRFFSNRLRTGP
jgi:non-heme chloroperoxidase